MIHYTDWEFIALDTNYHVIGRGHTRAELQQQFPTALIIAGSAYNLFLFNKQEQKTEK